ncbi:MAG: hypothetical protein CMB99_01360 [Flavobacteriaceae bacterium]|nr:hypothetical protein [Flavobacteriaceae bacterium]
MKGMRGPVLSFNTHKRIGDPVGTWEVALSGYVVGGEHDGDPWLDIIDDGDWVVIDVYRNGKQQGVMIGRVADVSLAIAPGGTGAGEVTITVNGNDVADPLQATPVYWNPYDSMNDNALGFDVASKADIFKGRADEIIPAVIRATMGRGGLFGSHLQTPEGFVASETKPPFWMDMLDLSSAVVDGLRGETIPNLITSESQPSLWGWISDWRNPVMNEMWVDTTSQVGATRKAYLHLRERPFVNAKDGSQSPWFSLPTREVKATTLSSVAVSKGLNRVNHIMLVGELMPEFGKDAYGIYRPIIDKESIRKYGLNRLEESTQFFDDVGGDTGFGSEYLEWLDLIISWNCLNHDYYQGQITIAEMRPDIRVGQKVAIVSGPPALYSAFPADGGVRSRQMTFYVEGVSHVYQEGENPITQTQLMVSRGYVEGDRVKDLVLAKGNFSALATTPGGSNTPDAVLDIDSDAENAEGQVVLT